MKNRLIYLIGSALLLFSPIRIIADDNVTYQYWIDNDIGNAQQSIATSGLAFNLNVDVASLSSGMHFLNVRAKTGTVWGTLYRLLFCIPIPANAASSAIQKYEYWIDNDYANRTTIDASGSEITPSFSIDVSELSSGVHFYNVRTQDASGAWGIVSRTLFVIPVTPQAADAKLIAGYRYSFNGVETDVPLETPVAEYVMNEAIDVPEPGLPTVIDNSCVFTFSGDNATLSRNMDMTFKLTFYDNAGVECLPFQYDSEDLPLEKSFVLPDTKVSAISTLPVVGGINIPEHSAGGYTVAKFVVAEENTFVLKASTSCSLRLYAPDGTLLNAVSAETMATGYARYYDAGTYYAVAFGNDDESLLTINVSDVNLQKPTITFNESNKKVTISSAFSGATFHYTLDGSDPTESSTTYTAPFDVAHNMTVKAIAVWDNIGSSPINSLLINSFTVADPVFAHDENRVTISTTTSGATIYYTINGATPTASCTQYTGTITVQEDDVIRAIAMYPDFNNSAVETLTVNWFKMGDVNSDLVVNVADAVAEVNYILEKSPSPFTLFTADMNEDGEIDVFDVMLLIGRIIPAPSPAPSRSAEVEAMESLAIVSHENAIRLNVDHAERFTAFQFELTALDENIEAKLADGAMNHILKFTKVNDHQYMVVCLSMTNELFSSTNDGLIEIRLPNMKSGEMEISNILFVTPDGQKSYFRDEKVNVATGIKSVVTNQEETIYDLSGRRLSKDRSQLRKGIYIINGKKVTIK